MLNKAVRVYSYLRFCGNILCSLDPNENLWLTEATGMDMNSCGMQNSGTYSFLLGARGCCKFARGKNEELEIL